MSKSQLYFLFRFIKICAIKIEKTNSPQVNFALSCVYDAKTKSVYYGDYGILYCDVEHPCIFRYDTVANRTYQAYIEGQSIFAPDFIIPMESQGDELNRFACGLGKDVAIVSWDGVAPSAKISKILLTLDPNNPSSRTGIGHRDPSGKSLFVPNTNLILCGGAANGSINLYRKTQGLVQVIRGTKLPSGYAFDTKRGFVYILDSCSLAILGFRSDCDGDICKKITHLLSV